MVALIPTRGAPKRFDNTTLLEVTIDDALRSSYINEIIVATDNEKTAELAKDKGAKIPALRPSYLSEDYFNVTDVLSWVLEEVEKSGTVPDLVVVMEETMPFRPLNLIDEMIMRLVDEELDSIIAVKEEPRRFWLQNQGEIRPSRDYFIPRKFSEERTFISLFGLGYVARPNLVREGCVLGNNTAIYEVDNPFCVVEIRDEELLRLGAPFIKGMITEKLK